MDPDRPTPPGPDVASGATAAAGASGSGTARRRPPGPLLAEATVVVVIVALIAGYVWVLPAINGGSPAASPTASAPLLAIESPGGSGGPSSSPEASTSPEPSASAAPTPRPTSTTLPGGPIAHAGGVVVLENDGSLAVIDAATSRQTVLATGDEGQYLFPAWSPDGSRIAAIRVGSAENEIEVFDAARAETGEPAAPIVVLRSSDIGPFYLSWSPDGTRISYLANESGGLSLRIVPADGSAPVDGSAPDARIKTGSPLYYDWVAKDRLLAHIGTGADAFLGELAIDGSEAAPAIQGPGDFRSATVSHDGKLFGYIRADSAGKSSVVLAARDGSTERTMPVFGSAAVTFAPVGDLVASIGPTEPQPVAYTFPFGPLRVLDAAGKVRTLLDGQVVGFWWSPDGKTIAALRVQTVAGGGSPAPSGSPGVAPGASVAPAASLGASAAPTAAGSAGSSPSEPPTEVRLLFVDVASGKVGAQSVVVPGTLFINQFLTYFDQYSVSHQLWAPDSSSILLPVDHGGTASIEALPRTGEPARTFEGAMAFWSP